MSPPTCVHCRSSLDKVRYWQVPDGAVCFSATWDEKTGKHHVDWSSLSFPVDQAGVDCPYCNTELLAELDDDGMSIVFEVENA